MNLLVGKRFLIKKFSPTAENSSQTNLCLPQITNGQGAKGASTHQKTELSKELSEAEQASEWPSPEAVMKSRGPAPTCITEKTPPDHREDPSADGKRPTVTS